VLGPIDASIRFGGLSRRLDAVPLLARVYHDTGSNVEPQRDAVVLNTGPFRRAAADPA